MEPTSNPSEAFNCEKTQQATLDSWEKGWGRVPRRTEDFLKLLLGLEKCATFNQTAFYTYIYTYTDFRRERER